MKTYFTILFLLVFSFSISAQSKVVPLIDIKVNGLLGGVENGKFIDAKTTIQKLSAEQNYTLYFLDGTTEDLRMKKPTNSLEICDDFFAIDMTNEEYTRRFEKGGIGMGEGFRWNPQPRIPKNIDLKNAEYLKIVNAFLSTKRITYKVKELKQAVKIDLDGDSQDEVILTASRIMEYEERKPNTAYDEFSFTLLRKIVNGKVQNILIEGEFFPKSRNEYDSYDFSISSIADLNGDGKMEIINYGAYYEGNGTKVFEIIGNKAVEVKKLTVGCGV